METLEYKTNAGKGGIYALRNNINGKLYIGCTFRFTQRKSSHLGQLFRGTHQNTYLQKSYDKYGKDAFEFLVLEIIEDSELLYKREYEYIIQYKSLDRDYGYNLLINNTPGSYNRHTQETKDKIGKANKLSMAGRTPSNLEFIRVLQRRPIIGYFNDKAIVEFESCKKAGEILNIDYKTINNNCRGLTKTIKQLPGITFKYKDGKPVRNTKNMHK